MKNTTLIFEPHQIVFSSSIAMFDVEQVMMDWEIPLMQAHAQVVCHNQGDILEVGFGMGISSTYIQQLNPTSHTIIEIHPQIFARAQEWASDKPNVTLIFSDWYDCVDTLSTYDGIFFDTYGDIHYQEFNQYVPQLAKSGAYFTWWNNLPEQQNVFNLTDVIYTEYAVNPPQNTYFNSLKYYLPVKTY
jgi:type IV protein arginine methyltransferase